MTTPGERMPRFRCHTEVRALKIADVKSRILFPEDTSFEPFEVSTDFKRIYQPVRGGYYIITDDRQEMFVRGPTFEENYSLIQDEAEEETAENYEEPTGGDDDGSEEETAELTPEEERLEERRAAIMGDDDDADVPTDDEAEEESGDEDGEESGDEDGEESGDEDGEGDDDT